MIISPYHPSVQKVTYIQSLIRLYTTARYIKNQKSKPRPEELHEDRFKPILTNSDSAVIIYYRICHHGHELGLLTDIALLKPALL